MSLNCTEIDRILAELSLTGFFIQDIVQPSFDSLALFLYRGAGEGRPPEPLTLFICLAHGACRLHAFSAKVPKMGKPLRFMECLRARIRGARVDSAEQLGRDRIVQISLSKGGETFFLFVRLWSGAANILLTDGGKRILDVFYRRPARGEISGAKWDWTPSAEEKDGGPSGLFPAREFPLPPGAHTRPYNRAVEFWYAAYAGTASRPALTEEADRKISAQIARLEASVRRLENKRTAFLHADSLRKQGDLLTANLWAVRPGDTFLDAEDYAAEKPGVMVRIPLNPRLSPQENAARLYTEYKKALSGLDALTADIAAARQEIASLQEKLAAVGREENPLEIRKMLREQETAAGAGKSSRFPGPAFRRGGWLLLVGRNAAENDMLLRKFVRGSDVWLHVRDWPGGYVFIKNRPGKTVPPEILLDGATLAVFYSKGRNNGAGDVYCTQVKYLRRLKGAPKGTVSPMHEKNLYVKVEPARLRELERCREH